MNTESFEKTMHARLLAIPLAATAEIRCGHGVSPHFHDAAGIAIHSLPGINYSIGQIMDFDPTCNYSTEEMIGHLLIQFGEGLIRDAKKRGDPS